MEWLQRYDNYFEFVKILPRQIREERKKVKRGEVA